MQTPESQKSREERNSAFERGSLGGSVSLHLRLWTYGGPGQPLCGLPLEQDPEIAELIRSIVREGKAVTAVQQTELLSAGFGSAVDALTTAKTLQQRFLTFHRKTEPQQIVPSVLVYCTKTERSADDENVAPENMLEHVTSAQILVSETIYEQMKGAPGFRFNSKPVREASEASASEAFYELLWTDESTYGHLRQASRIGLSTVDRYLIQGELGRGAMGAVYKAYDQLIGRTVALKTISINRDTPDRDELIERLMQEAKAAGKLDHPNIITIYDVGQQDDKVYLSMQFIEGQTLLQVLADSGVPALPVLISWADQISSAVGYAHAHGVIHRDLKPANLMLTNQGVIKVLDFGIAKVENSSLTQTGLVVGTPSYMAPEQVTGKKIDHRADIFALGSVFYELVTHEKPFRGDVTTILYKIIYEDPVAPSLINPAVPGGIDAIIRRALAKDPDERFQSCEELRSAFMEQAARLNIPLAATSPSVASASKPEPRSEYTAPQDTPTAVVPQQSRSKTPVAAAVLIALVAVAGWTFYTKSHAGSFPLQVKHAESAFQPSSGSEPLKSGGAEKPSPEVPTNSVRDQPATNSFDSAKNSAEQASGSMNSGTSTQTAAPAVSSPGSAQSSNTKPVSPTTQTVGPVPQPTQNPVSSGANQTADTSSSADGQQNEKDQPGTENTSEPTAAVSGDSAGQAGPASNEQPTSALDVKPQKKARPAPTVTVDGFTRRDVPELLRQADAASGRGDFRLARYEYNLILKLDGANATARSGLHRIEATESNH